MWCPLKVPHIVKLHYQIEIFKRIVFGTLNFLTEDSYGFSQTAQVRAQRASRKRSRDFLKVCPKYSCSC
jgi:hypothetical protein